MRIERKTELEWSQGLKKVLAEVPNPNSQPFFLQFHNSHNPTIHSLQNI